MSRREEIDQPKVTPPPSLGVIAVILQQERFLVIRRSALVRAPLKLCFPGGGVENGECESDALVRELMEELRVAVRPEYCLWRSCTESGIELAWWKTTLIPGEIPQAVPAEVASVHWMTADEIRVADQVLDTNLAFLDFWRSSGEHG